MYLLFIYLLFMFLSSIYLRIYVLFIYLLSYLRILENYRPQQPYQKVPYVQISPTNLLTRSLDRLTCKTEALSPSEKSVAIQQSARRNIPKDASLPCRTVYCRQRRSSVLFLESWNNNYNCRNSLGPPTPKIRKFQKVVIAQQPLGLRRTAAATRLLGLRVRIPPAAWMSVCCECCVLSGRGLCVELITRPEDSYRL